MKCSSCNKNEAIQLFTSFAPCEACANPKIMSVESLTLVYPATGAPVGWLRASWISHGGNTPQMAWPRQELERVAKQCKKAQLNARAIIEGVPSPSDSIIYYFKE
jgi:hypothetical protein